MIFIFIYPGPKEATTKAPASVPDALEAETVCPVTADEKEALAELYREPTAASASAVTPAVQLVAEAPLLIETQPITKPGAGTLTVVEYGVAVPELFVAKAAAVVLPVIR